MSLLTEFSVPADSFALQEFFQAKPDATVDVERLTTHSREWIMPFLWVQSDDLDTVEAALRADATVDSVEEVDRSADVGLFSVHWAEDLMELVDTIVDQNGIMVEAEASTGSWYLKLRFIDHARLETFIDYFDEQGPSFELLRLHEEDQPKQQKYDLTPEQREALLFALEQGYYAVPRQIDLGDIAEEFNISENAISQRLRRGTANLLETTLSITAHPEIHDNE